MNILIADDSADKMQMLKDFVMREMPEANMFTATTTEQAMEMIDAHHIDLGLIDYYIPSQNGPSIIAYLRKTYPQSRIALVSSADSISNCAEAKNAGAEACICTTLESDIVERQIVELLRDWKTISF